MINAQGQQLTTEIALAVLDFRTLFRMLHNTLELRTFGVCAIGITTIDRMHECFQIDFDVSFLWFHVRLVALEVLLILFVGFVGRVGVLRASTGQTFHTMLMTTSRFVACHTQIEIFAHCAMIAQFHLRFALVACVGELLTGLIVQLVQQRHG